MSHDHKILSLDAKRNNLTDKGKLVYAYHCFQNGRDPEAVSLLTSVSTNYMVDDIYKDISRALLCHAIFPNTQNLEHGKESEFYLIVYNLTKKINNEKIRFQGWGYFEMIKNTLFKDLM